ncbi:MAG: hypothetical protein IAX22_07945 [Candidatus Bathyarchaeota archaeon]|nr:hypothetical protein [Candidatus Bathyarchaeota archaeon]
MKADVERKAKTFDPNGTTKHLVDEGLIKLQSFRKQYPFVEDQTSIEKLTAEDILKKDTGKMGDFFRYIEHQLKPLGHLEIKGTTVYRNIIKQLDDFKELLRMTVDKNRSLAEKIDAPWKDIKRLGLDQHVAKKIIFCFNYETNKVVPIFKTQDMEYFLDKINEKQEYPLLYDNKSLGEKYEYLTEQILKAKQESEITNSWEITYFCRFLYESYPPPKTITEPQRKTTITSVDTEEIKQKREFMDLLNELRRQYKISAEQLREYRDAGFKDPQARITLTEKLTKLK